MLMWTFALVLVCVTRAQLEQVEYVRTQCWCLVADRLTVWKQLPLSSRLNVNHIHHSSVSASNRFANRVPWDLLQHYAVRAAEGPLFSAQPYPTQNTNGGGKDWNVELPVVTLDFLGEPDAVSLCVSVPLITGAGEEEPYRIHTPIPLLPSNNPHLTTVNMIYFLTVSQSQP
jgi:hypothetical protein